MLKRVFLFSFLLFFSFLANSAPTTGGFAADAVMAIKPGLITDTSGFRYWDVAAVRAGTNGVATIAEDYAVSRVLAASRAGTIGLAGLAAVEAVKGVAGMCIWQTDKWHDCTQRPTIPINIDTSKIIPATSTQIIDTTSTVLGNCHLASPTSKVGYANDQNKTYSNCLAWQILNDSAYSGRTVSVMSTTTNLVNFQDNVAGYIGYWGHAPIYTNIYSCSSGTLSNSSGAPMAVTGQYCTPDSAYSCSTNYFRSDLSGNSDSSGLFCSYSSPVYDDTQAAKILAPYLLDYYANQLFTDKNGKPLDVFSAPNTTFDPTASPSTMPMTLDQLKQYVDWVRNGTAQTTDPLAPHYISPNNYDYTKNYINTNNTTNITNSTSSSSSTITPEQIASSAAMTQAQFEQSVSKADKTAADGINSADTSSLDTASKGGDAANDALDNMAKGIDPSLPIIAAPHFPEYSSCRTIDMSWNGYTAVFPTTSQCIKMEEFKTNLGYFLYLLTAVGLIFELLRRVD